MIKIFNAINSSGAKLRWLLFALAIISLSSLSLVATRAQSPDSGDDVDPSEDMRVARISLIQDYVSMQRGDDDSQWFDGALNSPLQTGDRLFTGDAGRSELQLGSSFFIRLDNRTGLDVVDLSSERSQFRMYSGSVLVNLRNQPAQSIEIDTPNAAITVGDAGEYRIDVISDTRAEIVVLKGNAEVFNGDQILVREGQRMILEAGDKPYYDLTDLPERDDWDQWNQQRDDLLLQEAESLRYVPDNQSIEGIEDLTQYGQWTDVPEYGRAWSPRNVSSDWAPYRDGGWVWRDPYGWTWVSSEPWGWAPYHYGRWAYASNRWYWVPGTHRRYSPALVGFIGYGSNGAVAWVPLAPRDRFNPWWGRRRTTFTEVVYINQGYRNTISYSTREVFGTGRIYHHDALFIRPGMDRGRAILVPAVIPSHESLVIRTNRPIVVRTVPTYFNRTVIVRNNRAPIVRPFAEKVAIIKSNGGTPVSSVRVTSTGVRETRQVVTQTRTTGQTGNNGQPRKLERRTIPPQTYTRHAQQSQGTVNGQQPKTNTNNQGQQPKTQTNGQQQQGNGPPTRRVYPNNQPQGNNGQQQQGNGKQQTGNGAQPQGNGQKPVDNDQPKRQTNTNQGNGQQPQNNGKRTEEPKRTTNNNTQPQGNNQPKRNTDTNSHPQGNTQHPPNNNQPPAKTNNNPPPARTTTQQPQKPAKKSDPPKKDDKSDKKKPPTN